MTALIDYLQNIDDHLSRPEQLAWYTKLRAGVEKGLSIHDNIPDDRRQKIKGELERRIRTEELKAWYGSPEGDMLFQGTSISSLTIPCELTSPLNLQGITDLEEAIADNYIALHDKHVEQVRKAIIEDVEDWIVSGLYYSVVVGAKMISQAFNLSAPHNDVVFRVRDVLVDPHEIISYPQEIRTEYFAAIKKKIKCFSNLDMKQEELESSLILSDISKPRIERYRNHILLAPIRCNEIATLMAGNIKKRIIEKTGGRVNPKSLAVVIYDTDTPFTYNHIQGGNDNPLFPVFPGLTVLGASGTINALRWLYIYRLSLIAQKIMKSSLYSEVHRKFIPFVFFGVLVPRDADILLDLSNLDRLRYRGNISAQMEYLYLLPDINNYLNRSSTSSFQEELRFRIK